MLYYNNEIDDAFFGGGLSAKGRSAISKKPPMNNDLAWQQEQKAQA